MRLLLVTDSLLNNGAYSIQGLELAKRLQGDGHTVFVYGATYHGRPIAIDGITMFGGSGDLTYGEANIPHYASSLNVDAVMTLKDTWFLDPNVMGRLPVPWIALCTVDTEPLSSAVKQSVNSAAVVVAVTRHAQRAFEQEGIHALYMPHGIDTQVFSPASKTEAREKLGLPSDKWIALVVGANQSRPSRKNLDQVMMAWDVFKEEHNDALLYLHTDMSRANGGIDLDVMAYHLRWTEADYYATDPFAYRTQRIETDYMVNLYRAADVLVSVGNEGVGMPVLEAQACGCPVIATDFAGQTEQIGEGSFVIPARKGLPYGEHIFSNLGAYHFRPTQFAIASYLKAAYETRTDATRGEKVRRWALCHDFDHIHQTYWKPAMQEIESLLMGAKIE